MTDYSHPNYLKHKKQKNGGGGGQLSWYKLPKLIRYNKTQTHSFKQV